MSKSFRLKIFSPRPPDDIGKAVDLETAAIIVSPSALDDIEELCFVDVRLVPPKTLSLASLSTRTVQVVFNDLLTDEKVAYISPLLWYNLRFQPLSGNEKNAAANFWRHPEEAPDMSIEVIMFILLPSFHHISFFQIIKTHSISPVAEACRLQLNLLISPDYPLDFDYKHLLLQHFATHPHGVYYRHDILAVPARLDGRLLYEAAGHVHGNTVVFFRLCDVSPRDAPVRFVSSKSHFTFAPRISLCSPTSLADYFHIPQSQVRQLPSSCPPLAVHVHNLAAQMRPYLLGLRSLPTGTFMVAGSSPGSSGSEPERIVRAAAAQWHLSVYKVQALDMLCEVSQTTEAKVKICANRARQYAPCVWLITDIELLVASDIYEDGRVVDLFARLVRELSADGFDWPVIVMATTNDKTIVEAGRHHPLLELFTHRLVLDPPGDEDRKLILESLLEGHEGDKDGNMMELVKLCSGFNVDNLEAVVGQAMLATSQSKAGLMTTLKDKVQKFRDTHLEAANKTGGGRLQVPTTTTWEDIGGLESVKQTLLETIELPLRLAFSPSRRLGGLKRTGILLHGPPGTGKTLLAKAVAAQCGLNFISVKGPELINKYVGQSEENVRQLFAQARLASPSVIFFDELDSLAPARGRTGDSGGVMDRVVSQLLAELDGIGGGGGGCMRAKSSQRKCEKTNQKEAMVFVIGATNRLDLIDTALLRPGRFDKVIEVPVATDQQSRIEILKALTRKFRFEEEGEGSVSRDDILAAIEAKCKPNMSGADFYALCSTAMFAALRRVLEVNNEGDSSKTTKPLIMGKQWAGSDEDDEIEEDEEETKEEDNVHFAVRLTDFAFC